eukprot:349912-Chlamydomonas_euryale.AAC.2
MVASLLPTCCPTQPCEGTSIEVEGSSQALAFRPPPKTHSRAVKRARVLRSRLNVPSASDGARTLSRRRPAQPELQPCRRSTWTTCRSPRAPARFSSSASSPALRACDCAPVAAGARRSTKGSSSRSASLRHEGLPRGSGRGSWT